MYFNETRSAIVMLIALGLASSHAFAAEASGPTGETIILAAAEGSAAEGTTATPAQPEPATDTVPSLGEGIGGAGFFGGVSAGAVGGVSQQSATAGYELGGAGIASGRAPVGGIMTSGVKGRPIRFENGIFIYPAVTTGIGYNDNVRGTNTDKVHSSIFVLRPEVVAEMKNRGDRYTLSYNGNYGHYASSNPDDFRHHEFWAAGDNYFTTRARLGWGVGYIMRSDPRGATDRIASDRPDRWHAPVLRVQGIYGAPRAIGRIELEASMMQKRYDNNRVYTEMADVDLNTVSGRFYYRFMPKTSAVFELRNSWADYVSSVSTMDNTDTRVYAGLTWDLAAKVSGTVKMGRAFKKFDSPDRADGSMNSWEADLTWTPLTYSKFDLVASRAPQDSTGLGNYTINTSTSLTWTHKWASYMVSTANIAQVKSDYSGDSRRDKTNIYGFGFYTEMGNRYRVGINWSVTDRNSNQELYDFKRNVTMLTLEAVL